MKLFKLSSIMAFVAGMMLFSCSGSDGDLGDIDKPNGGNESKELQLVLSKSVMVADGEDAVTIAVKKSGADVTGKAKVYKDNEPFEGTSFSTTEKGEYVFFASYEGEISGKITVKAIETGFVSLPEDPKPKQFSDFRHKTLLVQSTGTWCQYCPYLIAALHEYDNANGDAVIVAAHDNDAMANVYSDKVNNWVGANEFPFLTVNLKNNNIAGTHNTDQLLQIISSTVSNDKENESFTLVSASVSYSSDRKFLNVLANVKIAKTGKYNIAAWVLEDGIVAEQTNTTGLTGDFNTHNNVLRYSNTEKAYGESFGTSSTLEEGTVQQFACSFEISKLKVNDLGKCRIAIVTTNAFSGKFAVDNVVECGIGEAVAYEYK